MTFLYTKLSLERLLNFFKTCCSCMMSFFQVPDVQTMFRALFPGGEIIGEAVSILRDSYAFFSRHIDPDEGGRALVLAMLSLVMTIGLMCQRRAGNERTLMFTALGLLARHGSMVTLFGAPWFFYPILDHLLRNGNVSGVVLMMSVTSIFVGWGRDCLPTMSGFRQRLAESWSFGDVPDSSWYWSIFFFGLLFVCVLIVNFRCEMILILLIIFCFLSGSSF